MSSMRTVLLGFALAVVLGGVAWPQGEQVEQQLSKLPAHDRHGAGRQAGWESDQEF